MAASDRGGGRVIAIRRMWPWPHVRSRVVYGPLAACTDQDHAEYCEFCTDRSHWAPGRRNEPEYFTDTPVPMHRSYTEGRVLCLLGVGSVLIYTAFRGGRFQRVDGVVKIRCLEELPDA